MSSDLFTFAARSTEPNAEGRDWVVVSATDEQDALAQAATMLPEPYIAFPIPIDRARRLLNHINCHGLRWLGSLAVSFILLAIAFRTDEDGDIRMSWLSALGASAISLFVGFTLTLGFLAVLDAISNRVWDRAPKNEDIAETTKRMQRAASNAGCVTILLALLGVIGLVLFAMLR